jgi:drug/metabolite transporter (DMT)-like permease
MERSTAGALAATAAVVAWGLGNNLAKYIRLSGTSLAFNRLWIGFLWFTLLFMWRGGRLSWHSLRLAAPGGVAFALDVGLFFTSLRHTSIAIASIISALQPALVLLVAGPLFGERVGRREWGLTGLATAGVVGVVVGSSAAAGGSFFGDALATGALLAWTWYFIASKQARQVLSTLDYQASLTLVAAITLTVPALLSGHRLAPPDWSTLGWISVLVLVPGGGHLVMNWAHEHTPIVITSTLTLALPVVATALAYPIFGEPVTWLQLFSMAVVIGALGALLVAQSHRGGHVAGLPRPPDEPG